MNQSEPEPSGVEQAPEAPDESLEEMQERTAETLAEARKEVDRALETSHDQLMPGAQGGELGDYEDEEGVPEKEDTRGAWPNWTESESRSKPESKPESRPESKPE
jgi:hypothetical protein